LSPPHRGSHLIVKEINTTNSLFGPLLVGELPTSRRIDTEKVAEAVGFEPTHPRWICWIWSPGPYHLATPPPPSPIKPTHGRRIKSSTCEWPGSRGVACFFNRHVFL